MRIEVAEEVQCGGSVVASERVFEGGEVCVLKFREELITEGIVNITTFVVLSTMFGMLAEERLIVEESCPRQYDGCVTVPVRRMNKSWETRAYLFVVRTIPR